MSILIYAELNMTIKNYYKHMKYFNSYHKN
jgi:hypothetical protein